MVDLIRPVRGKIVKISLSEKKLLYQRHKISKGKIRITVELLFGLRSAVRRGTLG